MDDTKWCVNKICNLRLWDDEAKGKPWQNSVKSSGYELLLVSQFTLHAKLKGNKPDFSHSKRPEEAEKMFDEFVNLSYGQTAVGLSIGLCIQYVSLYWHII